MNIFAEDSYREIVKARIKTKKYLDKSISYAWLAEKLRIQPPYFSKVLNGHADFNSDQLYMCCQELDMNEEEVDYMLLLLEKERSVSQERIKNLSHKIEKIRFKHSDASKRANKETKFIDAEFSENQLMEYYLEPYCLIVHMFLHIPRYIKDVKLIQKDLGLEDSRFAKILLSLEKLKIIETKGSKLNLKISYMHLPRESQITPAHQMLMQQISLTQKANLPVDKKKSLTVTFTADKRTKELIEEELNNLFERVGKLQAKSNTKECYQLNYDLFSWS